MPKPNDLVVRLDLRGDDALSLIHAYPKARSLQSADGRTALHHLAHRGGDTALATKLLLLGCNPCTLDNYGQTAEAIAVERRHPDLVQILKLKLLFWFAITTRSMQVTLLLPPKNWM